MFGAFSFSWFMLPLGVALGVYWARQSIRGNSPANADLGALVPGEKAPRGSGPTDFDLQIVLGGVFRKSGEIDRALTLHQSLLERPGLTPHETARIRYELALDNVRSGVIDRAEVLLEELVAQKYLQLESLELLLQVREQAREWRRAIEVAHLLEALKSQSYKSVVAHYFCELAEEAQQRNDPAASRALFEEAAAADTTCVRAHLALGGLLEAAADFSAAIKIYNRVAEKAPRYIGEVLHPLQRCHAAAGTLEIFETFLIDAETRSAHPTIAQMRALRMLSQDENPAAYLSMQLEKSFSPVALDVFVESLARFPATPETLTSLRQILRSAFAGATLYRCDHCGFVPKTLFWQCPSCRHWGSVAPSTQAG